MTGTPGRLETASTRLSWRRMTVTFALETFAAWALWQGKLDSETWAWFSGLLASAYIGGDTFEKVAKLAVALRAPVQPGQADA